MFLIACFWLHVSDCMFLIACFWLHVFDCMVLIACFWLHVSDCMFASHFVYIFWGFVSVSETWPMCPLSHFNWVLTSCLTYLLTFFLTYLLTFCLTFFLTYLLTFFLTYLRKFCQTFFLAYCLTFFLTYLLTFCLAFFLTFYLTFFLTFYLAFEVRQGTLSGDGRGWGPAGNTGHNRSQFRSGREKWTDIAAGGSELTARRQGGVCEGEGGEGGGGGQGWHKISQPSPDGWGINKIKDYFISRKKQQFKYFLVKVSSEICLVGIPLQKTVEACLQRFLSETVLSAFFGRESLFRDSLVNLFFFIFEENVPWETLFGLDCSSHVFGEYGLFRASLVELFEKIFG